MVYASVTITVSSTPPSQEQSSIIITFSKTGTYRIHAEVEDSTGNTISSNTTTIHISS